MNQRSKKIINPWDNVFKEIGVVFTKPYKHFPEFLKLLHKLKKKNRKIEVLDLACGTGRHAIALAKLGYKVYGIDQSPKGLAITKKLLKKEGLNAQVQQGDVFEVSLPYKDNFFDAVLAIAIVYHSTLYNIHNLINEVSRTLKKDGLFFLTSAISVNYSMGVNSGTKYIQIEPNSYFPLDGREKWLPHHYFTKRELVKLLSNHFKNVNIFKDRENYYVTCCYRK